jgi:hypothetical protein
MTMNKDSPEVVNFMRLFAKLKDWSDDDSDGLPEVANSDESISLLKSCRARASAYSSP